MSAQGQAGPAESSSENGNGHHESPNQVQPEEGIKVAIRMRPLNNKESTADSITSPTAARVWKVLKRHSSITQTTNKGKPLDDRVLNRTFFTFDKTFGENVTTTEVYNDVAKGIVKSVMDGVNGTIFAYGQTSSGKTYTMQGDGGYGGLNVSNEKSEIALGDSPSKINVNNNHNLKPGIVHLAARDIFQHIQNQTENKPQRVYLLKVSYLEIYNEEVRDLLISSNAESNVLHIREDRNRGIFVNANENIVSSFTSVLDTLYAGEKNRSVASTQMNERSSRSHTIFRIIVESREKFTKENNGSDEENEDEDEDEDDENNNDDDDASGFSFNQGSLLRATLNLVDLAGSESVKHTGATGERMKEGAKINQSLLTLSRVMVSLSLPGQTHINFRDSKLTRILQPSLSGNARMAIICCATPSELYLEETRSTLQFASRAKLVKTHAQVNQVIDERSLVKKLQRELRDTKRLLESQRTQFATFEQLQKKCEDLQEELNKMTNENNVDQTRFNRLQNENNLLLNKIQAYETDIFVKNRQVEYLNSKLNKISGEKYKAHNQIIELTPLCNPVESKYGQEDVEVSDETHNSEANVKEFEDKIERFETQNEQLLMSNRELRDLLKVAKRELQNIKLEKECIEFEYEEFKLSNSRETPSNKEDGMNDNKISHILEKMKTDLQRSENKAATMREEMKSLAKINKSLQTQLLQSRMNKKSVGIQTNREMMHDGFTSERNGFCNRIYFGIWHLLGFFTRRRGYSTEIGSEDSESTSLEQKFI